MKSVRSAARALIIQDGKLLTIEMQRGNEPVFYILPGGGQVHGETLEATLKRECLEEIGIAPVMGPIAYVREYIGRNHTFKEAHKDFHQIEVVFRCSLPNGETKVGIDMDKNQIGVRWIPLDELEQLDFFPAVLKEYINNGEVAIDREYLGDIN
ncbi:NUDIX domain-containing protein [Rubellicoccus peritrichatus]|uniref:NUDIX domain-containing protein n=1 Tax=Rubellicoccus peritrichatus TaxID=3080537 RepID=A0AAQ3QTB4_9BACT|nr:NUDIX domain-containing protein [Puniceicoccus sp. CR14]WOO41146.1 NUDIX domain-containing protein [Puniceicoccus sp. CR14]